MIYSTHALISHKAHGADMLLLGIGSEAEMLTRWDAFTTDAPRGSFYSVREIDHELTQQAISAMRDRLTPKQTRVLDALALCTLPGRSIKPGSRKTGASDPRRWAIASSGMYSTDATAPARALAKLGLVRIEGLDFAPKSYRVTPIGRMVSNVNTKDNS